MPTTFRDDPPPWVPETPPSGPHDLPHGFLAPPELVRQCIAREKAKFSAYIYNAVQEERSLNDLTLQYYFESFGYEVLYLSTPGGPEVLAVGFDEMQTFIKDMSLEEQDKFGIWMP